MTKVPARTRLDAPRAPRPRLATSVVLVVVLALVAGSVSAQTSGGAVVQPTGIQSSYRAPFGSIGRLGFTIDQSGLGAPYVDCQTEFDAYVSSTSHANANSSMALVNSNGANQPNGVVDLGGTFTLDLGESLAIDGIGVWGTASSSEAISRLALYADSDNSFDNGATLLGLYDINATFSGTAFRFPTIDTRFVHLEVLGHGGGSFIRVGEFAARSISNPCLPGASEVFADGFE